MNVLSDLARDPKLRRPLTLLVQKIENADTEPPPPAMRATP
jgi:hypothetical protein